jgi:hypothetical protein
MVVTMKVMAFWVVMPCSSATALSEPHSITTQKIIFLQTNYTVKFILGLISEK